YFFRWLRTVPAFNLGRAFLLRRNIFAIEVFDHWRGGMLVAQTGFGIDGNGYDAFGRNRQFLGLALQDSPHVGHPDRQGDYGSGFAVTERARNIVSDPDHRGQMS